MAVGEVHADRRGFVEDQGLGTRERAVDEHRDQPVRVERQVGSALVRGLGPVDVRELERHPDLLEDDVRDQAGVAGKVVKLQHGIPSAPVGAARILAAGARAHPSARGAGENFPTTNDAQGAAALENRSPRASGSSGAPSNQRFLP